MSEQTPRPWPDAKHYPAQSFPGGYRKSYTEIKQIATFKKQADAELARRAVNSFDDLVAACKAALDHVEELREAWESGAITERDGLGGTRSNRNVAIETQLRTVLEKVNEES